MKEIIGCRLAEKKNGVWSLQMQYLFTVVLS